MNCEEILGSIKYFLGQNDIKTHLYLVAVNNSKFFLYTVIMLVCFLLLSYLETLYVILESIYDYILFNCNIVVL